MPLTTTSSIWKMSFFLSICLFFPSVLSEVLFMPQNAYQPLSGTIPSIPLNLASLFNNRAFSLRPYQADFDGSGNSSYPAQAMPPPTFLYSGLNYTFPSYQATGNDNLISSGQILQIPRGRYLSIHMLAAAENSMAKGNLTAVYADGTSSTGAVLVPPWWSWPYPTGGDLVFPYTYIDGKTDYNRSNIFQTSNWLDSSKELTQLRLPNVSAVNGKRLHVFAVTVVPTGMATIETVEAGPRLEVRYARSTQKWVEGSDKVQVVEVTVGNAGADYLLRNHSVQIRVDSPGLTTVQPGYIKRLRPGDQVRVPVGVVNVDGVQAGSAGNATIVISGKGVSSEPYTFNATYGIKPYEPTYDSVYSHEAPDWYTGGKYGIFIHWGVYAVPGWGNSGKNENYAEWYWWYLNQGPGKAPYTYEYHLQTYGPNITYDDFIANFTASAFDPKEWVDLFADAGATYFVQTSKHHDGYAIFDLPENVTKRTSVAQYPHRNLLQELFDASDKYQPHLHKATYFSLPEWFHPDYKSLGFSNWPGGNATNPYTNATLPYTGYVPVKDFVADLILPEMQTLADMGTEIMWCDIGGPNLTAQFASTWYNAAATRNRQVVMNARCGLPGDFDTPEYARYDAVQPRKWESNLGMDPYSYGYNRATPREGYMNASTIVTSLVDVVSKNGNFLLDVGPMADGTILEVEQEHLREAGKWIKGHAEAVFNTTYWFVTPQEGEEVRFTTTLDAFYVLLLARPNGSVVLESPVPWVPGDKVTVVGGGKAGEVVPSSRTGNGSLVLSVSDEVAQADGFAWVFKIAY